MPRVADLTGFRNTITMNIVPEHIRFVNIVRSDNGIIFLDFLLAVKYNKSNSGHPVRLRNPQNKFMRKRGKTNEKRESNSCTGNYDGTRHMRTEWMFRQSFVGQ